jgi:CRP/FNR family transcriptional regulator, cyclic AMP receptor protein
MLDRKIELLQQVPFFEGLPDSELAAIAGAGEKRYFEAGEKLIEEGEPAHAAFLILTGKANCLRHVSGEDTVGELWPGTLVGELGMLVESVSTVTVAASERLRALALTRDAFRTVMEDHPAIAIQISNHLLAQLQGLAAKLREVDRRLAGYETAA